MMNTSNFSEGDTFLNKDNHQHSKERNSCWEVIIIKALQWNVSRASGYWKYKGCAKTKIRRDTALEVTLFKIMEALLTSYISKR